MSNPIHTENTKPSTSRSLLARINDLARLNPAHDALVDEQYRISFGDLPLLIDQCAQRLREYGIAPNITVGLSIAEPIPHVLISLALLKLRAHQVTLETHESSQYIDTTCKRLDVSHVIRVAEHFDSLAPRSRDLEVTIREDAAIKLFPQSDCGPMVFLMTSGTTQGPRIIPISEHILARQAQRFEGICNRMLVLAPIQSNVAKKYRLRSLYLGVTSVFYRGNTSALKNIVEFVAQNNIDQLKISILNAVTLSKQAGPRLPPATAVNIGGTHVPIALRKMVQKNLSERLYVTYGSTESGVVAMAMPGEHDEHESVGKPLNGVAIEIIDENGAPKAAGQIGEIRMQGEGIIDAYHDDPTESARRFRGSWYYPGDLGSMTEDGTLILHGRKDNMMILNSINIYPSEIERAFERHPEVVAAAAFAIRSKSHGEIPAAAIELKRGSKLTEHALARYSRDRLGIRCARKVVIVDRIPRNAQGKILTREITKIINDDLEKS